MSNRVSKAVLLCEDDEQDRLVIAFLKCCGIDSPGRVLTRRIASRLRAGGNVGWVLDEFPKEIRAVRNRQKRAETLRIVLIDADDNSVEDRRRELNDRAELAGRDPMGPTEVALLIPKRHIETWIRSLLGEAVTEEDNCKKNKSLTKGEFRQAAKRLFEWSRENANAGPSCVASLSAALPTWRLIGSRLK